MNIQSSPPVCVAACSIPGCGDATSDNLPPCTSCWRWTWSLFLPAATRSDDWRGRRSWKRATRRLVTMAKQLLWIMMRGRRRQFSLHDPWVEDYQEARGEGDWILSVTLVQTHCWLAETSCKYFNLVMQKYGFFHKEKNPALLLFLLCEMWKSYPYKNSGYCRIHSNRFSSSEASTFTLMLVILPSSQNEGRWSVG